MKPGDFFRFIMKRSTWVAASPSAAAPAPAFASASAPAPAPAKVFAELTARCYERDLPDSKFVCARPAAAPDRVDVRGLAATLLLAVSTFTTALFTTDLDCQAHEQSKTRSGSIPSDTGGWVKRAKKLRDDSNWDEANKLIETIVSARRTEVIKMQAAGKRASAKLVYEQLERELASAGDSTFRAENLSDLALLEMLAGNLKKSEQLLGQARELLSSDNGYLLIRQACVQSAAKHHKDALANARKALFVAENAQQQRFHKLGWKYQAPLNTFVDRVYDPVVADVKEKYSSILKAAGDTAQSNKQSEQAKLYAKREAYSDQAVQEFAKLISSALTKSREWNNDNPSKDLDPVLVKGAAFGAKSAPNLMSRIVVANGWESKTQYDKSVEHYRAALSLAEKLMGDEHPLTLQLKGHLAYVLVECKDYSKAEVLYREVVAFWKSTMPEDSTREWNSLQGLIPLYQQTKNVEGELSVRRRLLALTEIEAKSAPSRLYDPLKHLAEAYEKHHQYEKADQTYSRLVALRRAQKEDNSDILEPLTKLARVKIARGQLDDAAACYQTAIKIAEEQHNEYTLPSLLDGRAKVLRQLNREPEADSLESKARLMRVDEYPSPF